MRIVKLRDEVLWTLLVLLTLLLFLASYGRPDDFLDRMQAQAAEDRIARILEMLNAPAGMRISVTIKDDQQWNGSTVKATEFFGCRVMMKRAHLTRMDVLAHEACHCVRHWNHLTPRGWGREVTDQEIYRVYEPDARRCVNELESRPGGLYR